jgi:hypothetical protein
MKLSKKIITQLITGSLALGLSGSIYAAGQGVLTSKAIELAAEPLYLSGPALEQALTAAELQIAQTGSIPASTFEIPLGTGTITLTAAGSTQVLTTGDILGTGTALDGFTEVTFEYEEGTGWTCTPAGEPEAPAMAVTIAGAEAISAGDTILTASRSVYSLCSAN